MRRFNVTVNGVVYDVVVEEVGAGTPAAVTYAAPVTPVAPAAPVAPAPAAAPTSKAVPAGTAGAVSVKAPLQGTVMKVMVKPGDAVKKGTPVCVIEALKMENDVVAPQDGTVASVEVKSGESVKTEQVLITMN